MEIEYRLRPNEGEFKVKIYLLAAVATAAFTSSASAATYIPVGPQTNVEVATVTGGGWSECYSSTYGSTGQSVASILKGCNNGDSLMLAAREIGSDTFLVLAQALRADVLFDTGRSNVTHNANGTEWYFSDNYSWGFAPGGETVTRNSCDTTNRGSGDRLCWHTRAGNINGGWRAGSNTGLNSSDAFERVIYTANASIGAVPEPATWAFMIFGFGAIGGAMRSDRHRQRKAIVKTSYA